jgi:hypothetical protein
MNDLQTLHDVFDPPAAPSSGARAEARAALLERARRRPRRRRALVAALAAAGVAVAVVATNLGGSGPDGLRGVPIASAEVLERAAAAAEGKPFTPPRDDQWIYFEDRWQDKDGNVEMERSWRRADGGGMAWIDEHGRLRVEATPWPKGRPRPQLEQGYKGLARLPTDPDALLRWAYNQAKNITGAGLTEHGDVYGLFNHILRGNVVPPDLEAAVFRALKRVPGVELTTVEVLGRPAYSLGQTEDWLHEELLLDRETYTYLGERSTVTKHTWIDPMKAGNETGEIRKGEKVVSARIETAIVDEPGERP